MPLWDTTEDENDASVIPSGTELPVLSTAEGACPELVEGQWSGVEESRAHGNEISRLPSAEFILTQEGLPPRLPRVLAVECSRWHDRRCARSK
jgi:hypothetical protein